MRRFDQLDHYVDQNFATVRFIDEEPLRIGDYRVRSIPYSLDGDELDATISAKDIIQSN